MITIVIPIIKLNEFSRQVLKCIGNDRSLYSNLEFLFAVSCENTANEVRILISGFLNTYQICVANNFSSNYLRGMGRYVKTKYVFFQDCDDYVNYNYLNSFDCLKYNNVIYCFNVYKHLYDINGNIANRFPIFSIQEGFINDIKNLPTCIYSKIIPTIFLDKIWFPNLPYSQDWAISYQLYFLAQHYYLNTPIYTYNNYPNSSSQTKYSTKWGTNRVYSFYMYIYKKLLDKNKKYEAAFLRFRYSLLLHERYKQIGIKYFDFHITPQLLFRNFKLRNFVSVLYNEFYLLIKFISNIK